MQTQHESIEDYQITVAEDIDFLKLIKILKSNKYEENPSITKKYVHSLFTPLLSYIIDYLNHNADNRDNKEVKETKDEVKPKIGKKLLNGIPILYALLDKKIYDLFFKKEKGLIGKEEINYNLKPEKENYYISSPKKIIQNDKNDFTEILGQALGENVETLLENDTIEKVFELKKKEIISMFRYGYSVQERIINFLKDNSGDTIEELPNIIFYGKNHKNKLYSEIDRIIKVKENIEVNNFHVYLKAQLFSDRKKEMQINEIDKDENFENLKLEKDSCYFIEVKTSIFSLFEKEKPENIKSTNDNEKDRKNDNEDKNSKKSNKSKNSDKKKLISIKAPSDLFSDSSYNKENIPKKHDKFYLKIKAFNDLFYELGYQFKNKILVIIIDSYFPKDFIALAKKFLKQLEGENYDFDFYIYFVHFEINIEYTHQITILEQMKKIENDAKIKEEQMKNLKIDSLKKDKQISSLYEKLNNSNIEIRKLNKNIDSINSQLNEMKKKQNLKKMKKKIQKDFDFNKFMEDEIEKEFEGKINIENCFIITKHQIKDYQCTQKLNNKIKCDNIIDLKTFCLIYYDASNTDLIDDIKKKHFTHINKYLKYKDLKKIIFLVDFVFLYWIKELMEKFVNYNILVRVCSDYFFKVVLYEKDNKGLESTCLFLHNILGTFENDLFKYKNMKNFIDYYFQILQIIDKKDIINFPIYNPVTDGCDYYLKIEKPKKQGEDNILLILIVDHIYEYEDVPFERYEGKYKYFFILFKINYFQPEYDQAEKIPFFFQLSDGMKTALYHVNDVPKTIYEDDYKYIIDKKTQNVACIIDKISERIQFQYLIVNDKFFKEEAIDLNIKNIMQELSKFDQSKNLKILIEEPFNLIYTYIKEKYKNCNIVLINNSENDKINNFLSTKVETKYVNTNIYSYLNEVKDDDYYDIIILQNNCFPDEQTDIIPKTLFQKGKKFNTISNHLIEGGKFCFSFVVKNIFLKQEVDKIMRKNFKNVNLLYSSELEGVAICWD